MGHRSCSLLRIRLYTHAGVTLEGGAAVEAECATAARSAVARLSKTVQTTGALEAARGVKAQQITTREGAPSVIQDVEEVTEATQRATPDLSDQQQAMLDDLKAAELVRQEEVAKIRQANCEQSRQVLSNLSRTARIRVRDTNGEERAMGEDERQRRIEEAQQGIVANCNTS